MPTNLLRLLPVIALVATLFISGCKETDDTDDTTDDVPEVYKKIYGASEIYLDGDYVVIKSTGRPDHKSPYYQNTQWSNLYEAYNGSGQFNQNPNKIGQGNYVFRIPRNPVMATTHSATALGPIGVSLNGVPFYNQYAGPNNQALTHEIVSFDQYAGHPDGGSFYHYHVEPTYLTGTKGTAALLGFLLDGFPVYGPEENGQTITNNDLDAYHGHFAVTADYPNGIYHYHVTDADPYLNGDGYYGTPGTATR